MSLCTGKSNENKLIAKMVNITKKLFITYFTSWWLPFVAMLCVYLILIATVIVCLAISYSKPLYLLGMILFVLFVLALVGTTFAAIWNLIRKRWAKGLINLSAMFLGLIATIPFLLFFLMLYSFLGPSEDGFADKLTIPEKIEISEPLDQVQKSPGGPEDTFQAKLLAAIRKQSNGDPTVTAKLPSLVQLHKNEPEILQRYLATSPCWRVFTENGALFATRRWMIGSDWLYDLHGYYSRSDIDLWRKTDITDFQTRLTLGLSGKPWARLSDESTSLQHGQTERLILTNYRSHCVVTLNELVVEIFEDSVDKERRLTKAALLHIEDELRPLVMAPEFPTIQNILPPGSIKHGQPTIELRESFQPGIYDSEIWVNPGEPGMIYLKAYELTQEHRLSATRLKRYSNEWIGWSDDPLQLFFSNTHFTIYEGDWGKPYAARFEVWFVPDSGEPEHKLIEKIFKIEGWQR